MYSGVLIRFEFNGKQQQIILDFAMFGKYVACAYVLESENENSKGINDFCKIFEWIPFYNDDKEYRIALVPYTHTLEVYDGDNFVEVCDYELSV